MTDATTQPVGEVTMEKIPAAAQATAAPDVTRIPPVTGLEGDDDAITTATAEDGEDVVIDSATDTV